MPDKLHYLYEQWKNEISAISEYYDKNTSQFLKRKKKAVQFTENFIRQVQGKLQKQSFIQTCLYLRL